MKLAQKASRWKMCRVPCLMLASIAAASSTTASLRESSANSRRKRRVSTIRRSTLVGSMAFAKTDISPSLTCMRRPGVCSSSIFPTIVSTYSSQAVVNTPTAGGGSPSAPVASLTSSCITAFSKFRLHCRAMLWASLSSTFCPSLVATFLNTSTTSCSVGEGMRMHRHRLRSGEMILAKHVHCRMTRQVFTYFSMVRRRAAWAWPLRASASWMTTTR
mmetsp:Transcript_1878/g.4204  ORF Transcript_1878/g.4204 Transcript_1878/m.4204 type:complete len:217 (-) Transcript_1878:406-1056(-)